MWGDEQSRNTISGTYYMTNCLLQLRETCLYEVNKTCFFLLVILTTFIALYSQLWIQFDW